MIMIKDSIKKVDIYYYDDDFGGSIKKKQSTIRPCIEENEEWMQSKLRKKGDVFVCCLIVFLIGEHAIDQIKISIK